MKEYTDIHPFREQTFYGIETGGDFYVNGSENRCKFGEEMKQKIDMAHFAALKNGYIDVYIDGDSGIWKVCVVGILGDDKEPQINGLKKAGNEKGWVPHFTFYDKSMELRIASIDYELYGKEHDYIKWEQES